PNDETQPEFGVAMRNAEKNGVHILAFDCKVTKDSLDINKPVPVKI
ncbi:MAG: DNA/RNA nuclease SfsA, partial [Oscillospiraceae bacterium]